MRFDDMIATVMAVSAGDPGRRATAWSQLVDLLAQCRLGAGENLAEAGFAFLREHRAALSAEDRREAALAIAGRRVNPEIVAFFAEDDPFVAEPLIAGVRLDEADWAALIPRLDDSARDVLRRRRDLPASIADRLSPPPEPACPPSPPAGPPVDHPETTIQALVERIESYRRERERGVVPVEDRAADGFRWETAVDGLIRWIEGAPREALIGASLASPAAPGEQGADAQIAGAFARRSPFRDARFTVSGAGGAAGDWRLSGVPVFDPAGGRFLGYRGTARRPRIDEVAAPGLFGSELAPDSLRELVHELRTPLNAIIGFAELIEGEFMGPASAASRVRAADIVEQARRLLAAVDDLDTAARLETHRMEPVGGNVDAESLLLRLRDSYARLAEERGSRLVLEVAAPLPRARLDPVVAERMFARLLAATIGLAGEGETLAARLSAEAIGEGRALVFAVDRPAAILGLPESALLDPGYSPDGDWPGAPALGLGFALRLVRNLAEAAGGSLQVGERRISLRVPVLEEALTGLDAAGA